MDINTRIFHPVSGWESPQSRAGSKIAANCANGPDEIYVLNALSAYSV